MKREGADGGPTCNLCGGGVFVGMPFHYVWEGQRFDGVQCRDCRLITLSPLPTDAQLQRLYGEDYFAGKLHGLDRLGVSYESWADGQAARARAFLRGELLRRRPGAARLLEIGAAMGHFLAAARDEGLEVAGVEISAAAARRAREKFGLDLLCANIEQVDQPAWRGRWDIVYAGDLFEHLRDPAGVLRHVHELLAPGGLFAINLPGTFNLLSTRLATPLLQLAGRSRRLPEAPYHLYEYTTATVGRLFAGRFGRVEVVNLATPPWRLNLKSRSPAYLGKLALHALNWPLTGLTGRYGDRMQVYGWKD